ncbi:hypothetical protein V6N13_074180 [Hibiscus sabdariffa]
MLPNALKFLTEGHGSSRMIGTELPVLEKKAIAEQVHPSNEGSAANPTHLSYEFPEPLDELLNETNISAALDAFASTPLMIMKPDGETIVTKSPNQTMKDTTASPNVPAQRGITRRYPMVVGTKAKKTRMNNPTCDVL